MKRLKKILKQVKANQKCAEYNVCIDNDIAETLCSHFGKKKWPENILTAYDYICDEIYGDGYTELLTGKVLDRSKFNIWDYLHDMSKPYRNKRDKDTMKFLMVLQVFRRALESVYGKELPDNVKEAYNILGDELYGNDEWRNHIPSLESEYPDVEF